MPSNVPPCHRSLPDFAQLSHRQSREGRNFARIVEIVAIKQGTTKLVAEAVREAGNRAPRLSNRLATVKTFPASASSRCERRQAVSRLVFRRQMAYERKPL
jgi:hypothetical protein